MAFKRRAEPTTVDEERAALRAQHAALEDLKRQLAERVDAVRERELLERARDELRVLGRIGDLLGAEPEDPADVRGRLGLLRLQPRGGRELLQRADQIAPQQ
jgi:hypothetical protein